MQVTPQTFQAAGSTKHRKILVITLCTAVFLYWTSLYLYVPTLPIYIQSKVSNLNLVGAVLSMYGLWQIIIRLPIGVLSDWAGARRPFILFELCLVAGGALLMGGAQEAAGLIAGRSLIGIGAGTWVPLTVLFTALFPPGEVIRATGILMVMNSLGRMLATGVNGTLNQIGGYSMAFRLAAGAAVVAAMLVALYPEKRRPIQTPTWRGLSQLFLRKDVLLPALLSALLHFGDYTATFGFIPILARRFAASDNIISLLTSSDLLVAMLGSLVVSSAGRRIAVKRLLTGGFLAMGIGLIGAAAAPNMAVLTAAQLTIGLGYGICYPALMGASIQNVGPAEVTSAMGLHQSVYSIGMFTGPWLGGILANQMGIQPMFGLTAGILLVLSFLGIQLLGTAPAKAAGQDASA